MITEKKHLILYCGWCNYQHWWWYNLTMLLLFFFSFDALKVDSYFFFLFFLLNVTYLLIHLFRHSIMMMMMAMAMEISTIFFSFTFFLWSIYINEWMESDTIASLVFFSQLWFIILFGYKLLLVFSSFFLVWWM